MSVCLCVYVCTSASECVCACVSVQAGRAARSCIAFPFRPTHEFSCVADGRSTTEVRLDKLRVEVLVPLDRLFSQEGMHIFVSNLMSHKFVECSVLVKELFVETDACEHNEEKNKVDLKWRPHGEVNADIVVACILYLLNSVSCIMQF